MCITLSSRSTGAFALLATSKLLTMSYGKNPYQQPGQQPPLAYSYGQYYSYQPPPAAGTSGATPYPTIPNGHTWPPPPTGVAGYGQWPHTYSYTPGPQPQAQIQVVQPGTARPLGVQTAGVQPMASTPTPGGAQTPKTTTFSSYSPYYTRESTSGPSGGGGGRASRKQANFKGMFSKECKFTRILLLYRAHVRPRTVKNLMYGFGDDRNPGNDTVNVMEEILVEFITDVVRISFIHTDRLTLTISHLTVPNCCWTY